MQPRIIRIEIMARYLVLLCIGVAVASAYPVDEDLSRVKRGAAAAPAGGGYGSSGSFGFGSAAGAYGGTGGGYGGIDNAAASAQAFNELGAASYVANHAADNAIASVVRSDYQHQLANTALFVSQYTAPVTQNELHNAYQSVHSQQAAGQIAGALTNVAPAIWDAANSAAQSNFAQAYQVSQSGSLAAAAHNAYAQQAVQLAGSAQAAEAQNAAHAAAYASAAKTSHVAIDAAALQAIQGISSTGHSAGYGGGYGGGGGGHYGK